MRHVLIIGNWKMNGSRKSVRELLNNIKADIHHLRKVELSVGVPAIFIPEVQASLTNTPITWGAQDVSIHNFGPYTGEISASMLLDYGCKYVIIGHSERRTLHAESNQDIAKKYEVAVKTGLVPILCLGETIHEREIGITKDVIAHQIDAIIDYLGIAVLEKGVIAYEPVWAIGTGKTATPKQAQEIHSFIRKRISEKDTKIASQIRILYGGSMNALNAAELLVQKDIDGGLIGSASLKAKDFLTIARSGS